MTLTTLLRMTPFEPFDVAQDKRLRMAMGFGLPGEVRQEYAGYGFSAAVERCHPPMIELMF